MGRQYLPGGDENEVVSDWHAVVTCRPAVACFGIGGRRRLSCDVGGQPGGVPGGSCLGGVVPRVGRPSDLWRNVTPSHNNLVITLMT